MPNEFCSPLIVILAWVELLKCFSEAIHNIVDRSQLDRKECGAHQVPLLYGLSDRGEEVLTPWVRLAKVLRRPTAVLRGTNVFWVRWEVQLTFNSSPPPSREHIRELANPIRPLPVNNSDSWMKLIWGFTNSI